MRSGSASAFGVKWDSELDEDKERVLRAGSNLYMSFAQQALNLPMMYRTITLSELEHTPHKIAIMGLSSLTKPYSGLCHITPRIARAVRNSGKAH